MQFQVVGDAAVQGNDHNPVWRKLTTNTYILGLDCISELIKTTSTQTFQKIFTTKYFDLNYACSGTQSVVIIWHRVPAETHSSHSNLNKYFILSWNFCVETELTFVSKFRSWVLNFKTFQTAGWFNCQEVALYMTMFYIQKCIVQ